MGNHSQYRLHSNFRKEVGDWGFRRFKNHGTEIKRALLVENWWKWFEKTVTYKELCIMRDVAPTTFNKLTRDDTFEVGVIDRELVSPRSSGTSMSIVWNIQPETPP